jgi:hypothetical protein
MRDVAMASNGLHSSVHLAVNGTGKMPIQPTPGAIRKAPNLKPKQRKSRTGCMTCKAKRLKCDEGKVFPFEWVNVAFLSTVCEEGSCL